MAVVQPTKVALRSCKINGAEMRLHTNKIAVYESMCKPYITAVITINDNNNVINDMQLRGGERVTFVIDPGLGKIYEQVQYVLGIKEIPQENIRDLVYEISTAGEAFFNDRASMVQRSDVNTTMTNVAQLIHNEFIAKDAPLKVMMQSLGMIAKKEIGGFVTNNKKPFKAIEDILSRASYGGFKTGSTVYFRNANEYVMAPLELLFKSMSPQETFIQKQTWGADWRDTFDSYNAIIHASTTKDEDKSSRGGASNLAMAAKGALNMWDVAQGKEVIQKLGQAAQAIGNSMGGGSMSKFAKGKFGGIQNILQLDTRRNEPSTDQGMNAAEENMFQAQVKDSVNYYIKVPIQSGVKCTVGKAINAKLMPPTGDLHKGKSTIGGLMLVADLVHECIFTDTLVQGTTTMRAVQIGYN